MRLKSCPLCCAFAWSPAGLGAPPMLATASYAGAMGDDFDSESTLEVRLADVTRTDETDLPVVGRTQLPERAQRVEWSTHGSAKGCIAVSCADGRVYIYSAAALLQGGAGGVAASAALLWTVREHEKTGAAPRGCQFNPAQPQFLATGGDDGRWCVWDLPAGAPEPKRISVIRQSEHQAPIVQLQWHPKLAYIIGTMSADGVVNAWNLQQLKRAATLSVARAAKGAAPTCFAWDPAAAMQLAVGLDGAEPVVHKWDLRRSVEPVLRLAGHEGAVTSVQWCPHDASVLLSAGADGRTLWWDANSGERLGALAREEHYVVGAQWCPALPSVVATSSFEPLLCVATATGGGAGGASGGAGGSVSAAAAADKSPLTKKPCGAAVNAALTVVARSAEAPEGLGTTKIRPPQRDPGADALRGFFVSLGQTQPGSPERAQWLRENGYAVFAAIAAAQQGGDRSQLLQFLDFAPDKADKGDSADAAAAAAGEEPDPFAALEAENERPYGDRAAQLVARGEVDEAATVCVAAGQFADAFALAFLRGPEAVARVHHEYVAHVAAAAEAERRQRRHVLYAGAIASGEYGRVAEAGEDWRAVLALITTFSAPGEPYAAACDSLGASLAARGDYEAARVCFLCSHNVDGVAALLEKQEAPPHRVIAEMQLAEELCGAAPTCRFFTDTLCTHGRALLAQGDEDEAVAFFARAAALGNDAAARLADRLKYLARGGDAARPPPYTPEPTPDQPSPECCQFLAEQQQRREAELLKQQQAQQQQQQAQAQVAPTPPQHATPLQGMQQPPQQPPQPQSLQRPPTAQYAPTATGAVAPPAHSMYPQQPPAAASGYPAPAATAAPPPAQQYYNPQQLAPRASPAPQRPPSMPMQPAHQPPPQTQPPPQRYQSAPQSSQYAPPPPPPTQQQQQQQQPPLQYANQPQQPPPPPQHRQLLPHAQQQQQQQQRPASMPQPGGYAPPQQTPYAAGAPPPPPPPSQPPQSALPAAVANAGPPRPRLMPHPVSSYSSMRGATPPAAAAATAPPPGPSGAASPAAPPAPPPAAGAAPGQASLASFPLESLRPGAEQALIQRLQQILPHVPDVRRRAAIEAAGVELAGRLAQGAVPPPLVQQLSNYLHNAGTPSARATWAQLSAQYPGTIESIRSLGLL